eukprot:9147474-Alexandrium_andersonii.AAC.1
MSASLVGSEMCIRDRCPTRTGGEPGPIRGRLSPIPGPSGKAGATIAAVVMPTGPPGSMFLWIGRQ